MDIQRASTAVKITKTHGRPRARRILRMANKHDDMETAELLVLDDEQASILRQAEEDQTESPKILVVEDDHAVRSTLGKVLETAHFRVTTASSVSEALSLISSELFDVLLCDLHMPGAGDGFTVVSAMRHTNPAVTLVFTEYPALQEAMDAILLQADEILVKPMAIPELLSRIRHKLNRRGIQKVTHIERVATILKRTH